MTWIREVIHNFDCVFCSRFWSIALPYGAEHNLLNKDLYCPWCGNAHAYVTDDSFRGNTHINKKTKGE
jgi:hypothetical protein